MNKPVAPTLGFFVIHMLTGWNQRRLTTIIDKRRVKKSQISPL